MSQIITLYSVSIVLKRIQYSFTSLFQITQANTMRWPLCTSISACPSITCHSVMDTTHIHTRTDTHTHMHTACCLCDFWIGSRPALCFSLFNSWLSWRTMQILLMRRKQRSREKLREQEWMMGTWSLMTPRSSSQVRSGSHDLVSQQPKFYYEGASWLSGVLDCFLSSWANVNDIFLWI